MTSGLAVVVVTEVGMVAAGFSEALRPGRSAYRIVVYGIWSLRSCVRWARMESWRHV